MSTTSEINTQPTLRIVSFNVHFAKKPERIAQAIQTTPNLAIADVILFQEVESHIWEGRGRAEQIAEMLGMECIFVSAWQKNVRSHGLAILSRKPIISSSHFQLPFKRLGFRSRTRIALQALIDTDHGIVRVCNVHLDLRINAQSRIEQMQTVTDNFTDNIPTVVAGDLNTNHFYWAARTLPVFYKNQRKDLHNFLVAQGYTAPEIDYQYTMRPKFMRLKLDNIYSKGARIHEAGIEHVVRASDHKPIWADIHLS